MGSTLTVQYFDLRETKMLEYLKTQSDILLIKELEVMVQFESLQELKENQGSDKTSLI